MNGPKREEFTRHMARTGTCVHDNHDCWQCRAEIAEEALSGCANAINAPYWARRAFVAEGIVEALREVLLRRCPKHCASNHEDGACELTRREIRLLTQVDDIRERGCDSP